MERPLLKGGSCYHLFSEALLRRTRTVHGARFHSRQSGVEDTASLEEDAWEITAVLGSC